MIEVERPALTTSLERITDRLSSLSVADLTTLIADATAVRDAKLAQAKADLVTEFAARAVAMGLDPAEFGIALPKSKRERAPYRPLVVPPECEERLVVYLRQHQGRATLRNASLAAFGGRRPDDVSPKALTNLLADMVERGVLIEIRKSGVGQPPIFGLADMNEVAA